MNGETLTGLLKKGQMILAQAGIKEAGLDAWLLLEYVTGKSRAYYFAYGEESVTESVAERYLELISRRAGHIPLQHLTHQAFFMGHEFYVDKNVLVPRQDTETLVESALECMKAVKNPYILDMCTGSGCIGITLAKKFPESRVLGVDVSEKALKVAQKNKHNLEADNIDFMLSDLFGELGNDITFNTIVSNPPYIPTKVIETLQDEVRLHDPLLALDGTEDGLMFYRKITEKAREYLKTDGYLCYEIGAEQAADVSEIMKQAGLRDITVVKDLAGLDRVVMGRK